MNDAATPLAGGDGVEPTDGSRAARSEEEPLDTDGSIDRGQGKPAVAAVAEALDPNMDKHGPIKDGSCGGCHNVHGSDAAEIRAKSDSLMEASHKLAQAVYEKVQAEQTTSAASGNGESASDDEVVEDADYEVIDEEAKQS